MECREAKNADNLLSADTFSFMRNECSAEKWVVVELSHRIKLTAVDISMLELYSSRIKTFDVYVSVKKPARTSSVPWKAELWTHVATMKLQNKKGQQVRPLLSLNSPIRDEMGLFSYKWICAPCTGGDRVCQYCKDRSGGAGITSHDHTGWQPARLSECKHDKSKGYARL